MRREALTIRAQVRDHPPPAPSQQGGEAGGSLTREAPRGGPVVSRGRAEVGVGRGFLDVAQQDADVEGDGDERVAQGVRADLLGQAGVAGDPADDPPGGVPVEPLPGCRW